MLPFPVVVKTFKNTVTMIFISVISTPYNLLMSFNYGIITRRTTHNPQRKMDRGAKPLTMAVDLISVYYSIGVHLEFIYKYYLIFSNI